MSGLAGLLRGATRLRPDRVEVELEGRRLQLSNLDKPLYPGGFTKGDVIDHYLRIAPAMLPHLAGRPVTRKRYPNGVDQPSFFEKNAPGHRPEWVQTVRIPGHRRPVDYVVCSDIATLVWLANLAALELHTSLASAAHPDRPQYVVFDLDPGPGSSIVECCAVGLMLRETCRRIGLEMVAKTSGSKGLQVYVPLNDEEAGYDRTRAFARTLAEMWEGERPDLIVSRMARTVRTGRVLIDWSQNTRVKTTVCVYSLRAGPLPAVSTPVTWREVRACERSGDPAGLRFTSRQVLERVRRGGDRFAAAASLHQVLPEL